MLMQQLPTVTVHLRGISSLECQVRHSDIPKQKTKVLISLPAITDNLLVGERVHSSYETAKTVK